MKVLAVIQARMTSTRLPGKALIPILGKPMLAWQLERLSLSRKITNLGIATSDLPTDDALAAFCASRKVDCFRGSESNVLDRFYRAAHKFLPDSDRSGAIVIRLTGDCPLSDPFMLDEAIGEFLQNAAQGRRYLGYGPDLPDGMDFEIFTWGALEETYANARDPFELEHVTPFMWRNPERFGMRRFAKAGIEPGLRFSVDFSADRDLVEAILTEQQKAGKFFGVREVSELFTRRPELKEINSEIVKNEGLIKSALATAPFKTTLAGTTVTRFGVAVPANSRVSEELLAWATRMGVNAWQASGAALERLERFAKDNPGTIARLCSGQSEADVWPRCLGAAGWQDELLELKRDRGIWLETNDKKALAEMLMFLCQS